MSSEYYEKHGRKFAEATVNLPVDSLYQPFLKYVPKAGHILDAGCGSGRDIKAFRHRGFLITAIDESPDMVTLASEFSGQEVLQMSFQELEFHDSFDGIWACASLLHVPETQMDDVLVRLSNALKNQGVLYASFKHGTSETIRNGRFFNDYSAEKLTARLSQHPLLHLLDSWLSSDVRPERADESWLNALIRKSSD